MASPVRIYTAKKILTMYPEQPVVSAAAVMDGKILATGSLSELESSLKQSAFSDYEIDDRFGEMVLMPGLVDAHTHVEIQAFIYSGNFVSQIPWPDPKGGFFPVCPTKDDVIKRLKELDETLPEGEMLYAVAYDENKAGPFHISELDAISGSRPILISNLVFHRFWCNSALLEKAGINKDNLPDGVRADADGNPNGTLIETAGLMAVMPALPGFFDNLRQKIEAISPLFLRAGNTTVCEAMLGAMGLEFSVELFRDIFAGKDNGYRVVGLPMTLNHIRQGESVSTFIDQIKAAKERQIDGFRIGAAKLYTDGSLISTTAPAGWPGYWNGTENGELAMDPKAIHEWIVALHQEGIPTVTHTNTAQGCQIVLDAVKEAQSLCSRPDIRHRMDHCYTITEAQLRQAKALGVTIQFFTPQLYYYGDTHMKLLGPDRARNLTPVGTARRIGASWGFHNDPPGTPQLPWVGAYAAVNRLTRDSSTLLGPEHRVSVEEVLRAMTIEAAFQMGMDNEIGSIEMGKKADFCVLEKDPLAIDPLELKEMPVWGTIFEGEPFKAG